MEVSFTVLETQIRSGFEADNEFSFGHGELGTVLVLRDFLVEGQT